MARYAEGTGVSVENSRAEIERTLRRYKADAFGYMSDSAGAVIAFRIANRQVKFVLPLPDPNEREFTHTPTTGKPRSSASAEAAWEGACRQRWRALALVIKAKLEAVAAGITTVEDEFLAYTVLPDRRTVSEWIQPQIEEGLRLGGMPQMLLLGGPTT